MHSAIPHSILHKITASSLASNDDGEDGDDNTTDEDEDRSRARRAEAQVQLRALARWQSLPEVYPWFHRSRHGNYPRYHVHRRVHELRGDMRLQAIRRWRHMDELAREQAMERTRELIREQVREEARTQASRELMALIRGDP